MEPSLHNLCQIKHIKKWNIHRVGDNSETIPKINCHNIFILFLFRYVHNYTHRNPSLGLWIVTSFTK
jgi:hypothetical protein